MQNGNRDRGVCRAGRVSGELDSPTQHQLHIVGVNPAIGGGDGEVRNDSRFGNLWCGRWL